MTSFVSFCRGILWVIFSVYGAFSVSIILFPVNVLLLIPSITTCMMRRNIISKITQIFQEFLAATLYYIGNSKTIIHCENPKLFNTNERGILLVSNHRTVIDWMYVGWCYGSMMNFLSNFKVILKNALRNVPIFGWLMQLGMYIFLERHRDKDVPHISKVLSYLLHLGSRPSILIFPEGTDLSESNVEKSNLYAKENNLSPFYYVLRPKSTGLLTILNVMSQQSYDVHDVTVAYIDYEEKKRPGALSILFGEFPKEVHLYVKIYDIKSMPNDKDGMDKWLANSFSAKETMLKKFYESSVEERFRDWPSVVTPSTDNNTQSLIAIILLMSIVTYAICYSILLRWVIVTEVILYAVVSKSFNGFDMLELQLYYDLVYKRSSNSKAD